MTFNDRTYTQDALIKQLGLIELHGKDGSATEAGCECIETKHLFMVEGLAEEGIGFSKSKKEANFYKDVATWARELRKTIDTGEFTHPSNISISSGPHIFSVCERSTPRVKNRLVKCMETHSLTECRKRIKCP